ncbi:MBL fold metallo-hydrolase [Plantactinospora sp. B6F1]|uniref:MBL fold metallo-hydrolase n=1 Tax=Plantactinospora sp. B6F1 TaxID=3158971 RepID=UPI0032D8E790
MRLTKYTHACIRLEHDGRVLVIDPGVWTEPAALRGADAVLVTHEHTDHVDVRRLASLGVPVYAPAGAAIPDIDVHPVAAGEEFAAAGLRVRAFGGRHATISGGQPDCPNLGYLVEGRVYHPGDSVHRPGVPVETLLVPVQGSWLKTAEAIDFVRAVAPERAYGIHDAQVNDRGLRSVHGWLAEEAGGCYRWLTPGETA